MLRFQGTVGAPSLLQRELLSKVAFLDDALEADITWVISAVKGHSLNNEFIQCHTKPHWEPRACIAYSSCNFRYEDSTGCLLHASKMDPKIGKFRSFKNCKFQIRCLKLYK